MPGTKGRSGGARSGSGPIQRRYTLEGPAAIYIRALTQGRLNRTDVTREECHETLHQILREHAERLEISMPDDHSGGVVE